METVSRAEQSRAEHKRARKAAERGGAIEIGTHCAEVCQIYIDNSSFYLFDRRQERGIVLQGLTVRYGHILE